MHDVRALNELVATESAFIDTLTGEAGTPQQHVAP